MFTWLNVFVVYSDPMCLQMGPVILAMKYFKNVPDDQSQFLAGGTAGDVIAYIIYYFC